VKAVISARDEGRNTRAKIERVKALQRVKKKLLRSKFREYNQRMLGEIESLHDRNESRKFYRSIGNVKKGFQPRTSMCKRKNGELVCDLNGILERWREHFDELLNAGCSNTSSHSSRKAYDEEDGKEFPKPSRNEVLEAISKLKNNKAPGDDMLPAELFKAGGERLVDVIYELIFRVWRDEKLPEPWKTGVICPLHKKGCKLECGNYRGISLLPTIYKILSRLLSERLEPMTEDFLQHYQAGFRRGRERQTKSFACVKLRRKAKT
jgi:Reverse transcriptase (RNA-dependent DNA polymerase)